jgi:hypothetical protein
MRRGLEAMLANNPILLSFIVINPDLIGSNLGLYASVRQTPEILSRCIQVEGSVDTLNEVRAKTMNYPYHDHTRLPGPLFRALILSVRENNSTVAIVNSKPLTSRSFRYIKAQPR